MNILDIPEVVEKFKEKVRWEERSDRIKSTIFYSIVFSSLLPPFIGLAVMGLAGILVGMAISVYTISAAQVLLETTNWKDLE